MARGILHCTFPASTKENATPNQEESAYPTERQMPKSPTIMPRVRGTDISEMKIGTVATYMDEPRPAKNLLQVNTDIVLREQSPKRR